MSDSEDKKDMKELDKLVSNVGKVYSQWIKKGIIGPPDSSSKSISDNYDTPTDESEKIDINFLKKKKTENQ